MYMDKWVRLSERRRVIILLRAISRQARVGLKKTNSSRGSYWANMNAISFPEVTGSGQILGGRRNHTDRSKQPSEVQGDQRVDWANSPLAKGWDLGEDFPESVEPANSDSGGGEQGRPKDKEPRRDGKRELGWDCIWASEWLGEVDEERRGSWEIVLGGGNIVR